MEEKKKGIQLPPHLQKTPPPTNKNTPETTTPKTPRSAPQKQPNTPTPSRNVLTPEQIVEKAKKQGRKKVQQQREEEQQFGQWKTDKKTGKKYREMPKTEWLTGGYSESRLSDQYDASYDLNSIANDFLPHLRVAPTPEEKEKLRQLAAKRAKEMETAYNQKFGTGEDNEEDENS